MSVIEVDSFRSFKMDLFTYLFITLHENNRQLEYLFNIKLDANYYQS